MSNETMTSTMSSPIFKIFILQVDIHEIKVFSKYQHVVINKSQYIN
jgi:hypothetical protein